MFLTDAVNNEIFYAALFTPPIKSFGCKKLVFLSTTRDANDFINFFAASQLVG